MTRSDALAKSTRLKKLYRELLRLKPLQTLSKSNQWLESFSSGDDVRRTVAALAIDCRCSVAFRHKISEDLTPWVSCSRSFPSKTARDQPCCPYCGPRTTEILRKHQAIM